MASSPKKGGFSLLRETFNKVDNFGGSFKFSTGGKSSLTTTSGALLTLFLWMVLITYMTLQYQAWHEFGATAETPSFKEFFYSQDERFPQDVDNLQYPNFNFAFGISAYDGDPEPIDDPRYGRVFARTD